jgi:hypothetical protein
MRGGRGSRMGGLKAFPVGGGKGRAGVTEGKGGRLSRGMEDGAPGCASDRRWRFDGVLPSCSMWVGGWGFAWFLQAWEQAHQMSEGVRTRLEVSKVSIDSIFQDQRFS